MGNGPKNGPSSGPGNGYGRAARVSRRGVLVGAATLAAGAAQAAEDALLQSLIRQYQRSEFGHGFDATSRTIVMPKASLPTLSQATIEHTERAITRYEDIIAKGGWPTVPPVDRLSVGNRHSSVVPLRERLAIVGDLDISAGTPDVFDSYVEAAVRRFQARHGITTDGILREQSFKALNLSADLRVAQLKANLARLRGLNSSFGSRKIERLKGLFAQYPIGR